MRYFTQKEINELKQYEHDFYTSVKMQYKRNSMRRDCEKVADIFEETGQKIVSRNWSCGNCQLNAFKQVGEWYYASLQELEKEKETEDVIEKESEQTEQELKPKELNATKESEQTEQELKSKKTAKKNAKK